MARPRPAPPVELDMVVDYSHLVKRYKRCKRGYLDTACGVFLSGKNAPGERKAFVLLGNIYADQKAFFGPHVPEARLIEQVIATAVHEVLHGFILSGHRNQRVREAREHRAMARLLHHVGQDPWW